MGSPWRPPGAVAVGGREWQEHESRAAGAMEVFGAGEGQGQILGPWTVGEKTDLSVFRLEAVPCVLRDVCVYGEAEAGTWMGSARKGLPGQGAALRPNISGSQECFSRFSTNSLGCMTILS